MKIYTINNQDDLGGYKIIIAKDFPKGKGEAFETEIKEGELEVKEYTNKDGKVYHIAEII